MTVSGDGCRYLTILALLTPSVQLGQQIEAQDFKPAPTAADCTYLKNPSEFESTPELPERSFPCGLKKSEIGSRTIWFRAVHAPMSLHRPRRARTSSTNFFRADGARWYSARASVFDFEFSAAYIDFTGRPPSTNDVYNFIADRNPNKAMR